MQFPTFNWSNNECSHINSRIYSKRVSPLMLFVCYSNGEKFVFIVVRLCVFYVCDLFEKGTSERAGLMGNGRWKRDTRGGHYPRAIKGRADRGNWGHRSLSRTRPHPLVFFAFCFLTLCFICFTVVAEDIFHRDLCAFNCYSNKNPLCVVLPFILFLFYTALILWTLSVS